MARANQIKVKKKSLDFYYHSEIKPPLINQWKCDLIGTKIKSYFQKILATLCILKKLNNTRKVARFSLTLATRLNARIET